MGNIIVGIYDSIIPTEQGGDEKLLQSKVHNLAVRTFSAGDPIGPNSVLLNVQVGGNVIRVLVDKAELVKKLGLVSEKEIPDRGTETFVQEKILRSQIGKEINEKDLETLRQFAQHSLNGINLGWMMEDASGEDPEEAIYDKIVEKQEELLNRVRGKYPELEKEEYLEALKIASYYLACVHEGKRDLGDLEYAWNMDVNLGDLIELKTILMKGLKGFLPDVIEGIYHSIGSIEKGSKEQLLVSDEREYNLPVQKFSEHMATDPSKVTLNVRLEEGVVKVLVDKKDLAEMLKLEVGEEIPTEHVEQFVQEKVLNNLKKEAFSASELDAFKDVQGTFGGKKLILVEQQIKEISRSLKFHAEEGAVIQTVKRFQDKLLRRHPELNQPQYLDGTRLASFILANKTLEDPGYKNIDMGSYFGIPTAKITELEMLFLEGINWDISLSDVEKEQNIRAYGTVEEPAEKVLKRADTPSEITQEDLDKLKEFQGKLFDSTLVNQTVMKISGYKLENIRNVRSQINNLYHLFFKNKPELDRKEYQEGISIAAHYLACIQEGVEDFRGYDDKERLVFHPDYKDLRNLKEGSNDRIIKSIALTEDLDALKSILVKGLGD